MSSNFGRGTQQKASEIKFEGELRSIKDAGFTYDDLSYSSGNPDADQRIKEVIEFVNNDQGVQMFSITMKFAFLNDERITNKSYKGNGFYILGRTSNGLQSGTIYLTKRLVNRAMETNKDLLYVLALHECGHIWQHWVLIRNGTDKDDPDVLQKLDAKSIELGAEGWAGHYADMFLKKKYSNSAELVSNSVKAIVAEYFDRGDYFVVDKSLITDDDRKQAFLRAFNAKPMPYGPNNGYPPKPR